MYRKKSKSLKFFWRPTIVFSAILSVKKILGVRVEFIKSALYCLLARAVKSPSRIKCGSLETLRPSPYSIQTTPASRITASWETGQLRLNSIFPSQSATTILVLKTWVRLWPCKKRSKIWVAKCRVEKTGSLLFKNLNLTVKLYWDWLKMSRMLEFPYNHIKVQQKKRTRL